MTKEQYFEWVTVRAQGRIKLQQRKNADYTGIGNNPFENFTRVEALGICSTEQGFLTRMTDKMCRITSFVQKGILEVKDESVDDTLNDLAAYCDLMAAYVESKRGAMLDTVTEEVMNEPMPWCYPTYKETVKNEETKFDTATDDALDYTHTSMQRACIGEHDGRGTGTDDNY